VIVAVRPIVEVSMTDRANPLVSRRRTCLLAAGAIAALVPISGSRRPARAQDASALLSDAARAMSELETFRFTLETPRGETRVAQELVLLSLSGEVQRPDRFHATAVVEAVVARLQLEVIGIGTTIWVTDPLAPQGTTAFREIDLSEAASGGEEAGLGGMFADLLNPDRLLLAAVERIENPVVVGREEIDGVPVTRINGEARLPIPEGIEVAGNPLGEMLQLDDPFQVAVWVDDQHLVHRLDVYGPLLVGEEPNTVRRLALSDFNGPIDIQPPGTPAAG
jgi:hypothetical protein